MSTMRNRIGRGPSLPGLPRPIPSPAPPWMPRAADVPDVVIEHLEFPTDHNPLGVRGVGEGPTCAPTAAIANAIDDAFEGRLAIREPVLTPARVRVLIEQTRRHEAT